jgi:hypothetical protein
MTPTARKPFPPMNTASALSGVCSRTQSYSSTGLMLRWLLGSPLAAWYTTSKPCEPKNVAPSWLKLRVEPRRVDKSQSSRSHCPQGEDSSRTGRHNWKAWASLLKPAHHRSLTVGAADVSRAREADPDRSNRSVREERHRLVNMRRFGEGGHRGKGNRGIHHPTGRHRAERNTCRVDADTLGRHRLEL